MNKNQFNLITGAAGKAAFDRAIDEHLERLEEVKARLDEAMAKYAPKHARRSKKFLDGEDV